MARLGSPYPVYPGDVSAFRLEVAQRMEELAASQGHPRDYPLTVDERARVRTQVAVEFFTAEHGRPPADAREVAATIAKHSRQRTTAVAGYDLTFSPVKSISTLWAVAPVEVAAQIELAHHDAVDDALAFIEKHALYTREGARGVRQVDVTGLVATAFTHRDSRAGDPDLHTHVAVANKVQTAVGEVAGHRRAGAVQGHRHRLGDLQHRHREAPAAPGSGSPSPSGAGTDARQAPRPRGRRRRPAPERSAGPPGAPPSRPAAASSPPRSRPTTGAPRR